MRALEDRLVNFLAEGAQNSSGVLTKSKRLFSPHGLYSYPARFSPHFAGRAVETVSTVGQSVLDPFMGSGTTSKMAKLNNRNYIGSEISDEYCNIANERLT